jgi:hypothetical protein
MPTDSKPPTLSQDAFASAQSFANWLDIIRRVTISLAVIVGIGVVAILVVREVFREGIIIDPVIVQLSEKSALTPDLARQKSAPAPDLATQQITRYIDDIQRSGVSEWRKLYVDQSTSPIDLQVPGAPLTLKTSIREIASLFGVRQPTVRISIVIRRNPAGYVAWITVVGRPEARSTCEADDTPAGIDEILRCVALRAVGHIDPKVAAVYAFKREEQNCGKLDPAWAEDDYRIREKQRIKSRRERCSFSETQGLTAKMLENGDSDDMPWVFYVIGRIHLARAAALADIDRDQQLGELDQALGRFAASKEGMPTSPTALTMLLDTYLLKGVSLQESIKSAAWSGDNELRKKWRFQLAEWALESAEQELKVLPRHRSQALRVLVRRFEGKLIYLRWMLKTQQRTGLTDAFTAISEPDELELRVAAAHYAWAAANGPLSAELLIEWGNVLHSISKFDEAAEKFALAADFNSSDPKLRRNIAIAYLDGVYHKPNANTPLLQLLIALGASANYLGWSSNEDPSSDFIDRIKRALTQSGHPEDVDSFSKCVEPSPTAPDTSAGSGIERQQAIATLKVCVDQAIDQINSHNINAYYTLERLRMR